MSLLLYHLSLLSLLLPFIAAHVEQCGKEPRHKISRPHDCLDAANIVGHWPEPYRDQEFRFDPTHPSHVTYVPLPFVFRHISCALILYTDPEQKFDISAWYKIKMEMEAIYATCQTVTSGYGGRGLIGRFGRLTVGVVPAHDAATVEEAMVQRASNVSAVWEGMWSGDKGAEEQGSAVVLNTTRTGNTGEFSAVVL
ncbi:MAG: hypothetical protein LQ342_005103 [Letrouitia transgressa]|nr:MAG: hypothetical protein LQ342_005103 [Letrouitia transgressa]